MNDQTRWGDAELQLALRSLRRDVAPSRELWPGIAARLHPSSSDSSTLRRTYTWPWALAASLLLTFGLTNPAVPPQGRALPVAASPTTSVAMLPPEVQAMTAHYQAALRELDTHAMPANWQPGLQALDRSAAQIQLALRRNPDSQLLLGQLRNTYARRIALSRRALFV